MSSGLFTPVLCGVNLAGQNVGFNSTYTEQFGEWQISAGICFLWLKLHTIARDPTMLGQVKVIGLPVPARPGIINSICAVSASGITLDNGYTSIVASVSAGLPEINLVENGSGLQAQGIQYTSIPLSGNMIVLMHTFYPI